MGKVVEDQQLITTLDQLVGDLGTHVFFIEAGRRTCSANIIQGIIDAVSLES